MECWLKPTSVTRQQLVAEYERVLGTAYGADVGVDFVIKSSSVLNANIADANNQVAHEITAPANLLVAWGMAACRPDIQLGFRSGDILHQWHSCCAGQPWQLHAAD